MLEELQRRNYSPATIRGYLLAVEQFAKHFGRSPDKLGPDELRSYQAYLLTERKLAVGSVVGRVAALRFFFVRTLKRRDFWEELPYPKDPKDRRRLPTVLSLDEVARLIDAAGNLMQRALLMTLYGTGMRRAEVSLLKISDIDSKRMMIRVERGKGGGGRDIPLSPALLETLREYWRWKKPRIYLFPSSTGHRGQDRPMSDKVVWYTCKEAACYARIKKLGDSLARGRNRPAHDPGPARSCGSGDHGQVSPSVATTPAGSVESAGAFTTVQRQPGVPRVSPENR
jgi:integrase